MDGAERASDDPTDLLSRGTQFGTSRVSHPHGDSDALADLRLRHYETSLAAWDEEATPR